MPDTLRCLSVFPTTAGGTSPGRRAHSKRTRSRPLRASASGTAANNLPRREAARCNCFVSQPGANATTKRCHAPIRYDRTSACNTCLLIRPLAPADIIARAPQVSDRNALKERDPSWRRSAFSGMAVPRRLRIVAWVMAAISGGMVSNGVTIAVPSTNPDTQSSGVAEELLETSGDRACCRPAEASPSVMTETPSCRAAAAFTNAARVLAPNRRPCFCTTRKDMPANAKQASLST
mmetsp:Transcript_104848/g.208395  ORF Transcript_104848/g.208395 Transcript_104848/m.208395 type:complete len:235 (-) Transcript_104848:235-939(-)